MRRPLTAFLEGRKLHRTGYDGAARDCAKAYSRLRGILGENFDDDGGRERSRSVVQRLDGSSIGRCERPTAIIIGLPLEEHFDRAIESFTAIVEIQKGERPERLLEIVAPGAVGILE